MENVKNLVGKKFKSQFNEWLKYLEGLGYTNYWKVLNAKDYGVPQNRERVFVVSILGEHKPYEFPNGFRLEKRLRDVLEKNVDEKYYLSDEIQNRFKQTKQIIDYEDKPKLIGGIGEKNFGKQYRQGNRVYDSDAIAMCLTASTLGNAGGNSYLYKVENNIDYQNGAIRGRYDENGNIEQRLELREEGVANTITTVQKDNVLIEINEKENFTYNPSGENVIGQMGGDLWEKRHEQTRRVYDIEKVSPTIPTCSGGGQHPKILEEIENNTICEQRSDEGLRFFKDNVCGTIRTTNSGGDKRVIEKVERCPLKFLNRNGKQMGEDYAFCVDTCHTGGIKETYSSNDFRIRKLTPRECFRLMGMNDDDIDKIQQSGISNTQQYKMAGNSIVVDVLEGIFRNLFL